MLWEKIGILNEISIEVKTSEDTHVEFKWFMLLTFISEVQAIILTVPVSYVLCYSS